VVRLTVFFDAHKTFFEGWHQEATQ